MKESTRIDASSSWYLKKQLSFDKMLINFRYQRMKPYFLGLQGLELGPADGQMTKYLVKDFAKLTVVEGSQLLLDAIPDASNLVKVHSIFEEFVPGNTFSTIIMDHVLEHVEFPVKLLKLARGWLEPGGRILAGVPNGNSLHRLAAVKMALLEDPCQLNERDKAVGHRRVYTPELLRKDIETAGLQILKLYGVFLKPLSNQQIEKQWTSEMIQGFFELGADFPELSSDLQVVCVRS